jgi:hypothetical protein
MKRAIKHGMVEVGHVRAALDRAYKANADRLSPYSARMVWNSDRAATVSVTVLTKPIVANFIITDDEVLVESKIPFLFSHFEGRIMDVLGEQLQIWLAKGRTGEA